MAVRQPDYIIVGGGRSGGTGQTWVSEQPIGVMDGSNRVFTLSYTPAACVGLAPAFVLHLYLNEARQSPYYPVDAPQYVLNGNIVTYAVAPSSTDHHEVLYLIGPGTVIPVPGTARNFVGTDRLDWGDHSEFKIVGDLSFGCWVKLGGVTGYSSIVFQGNDGSSASGTNDLYKLGVGPTSGSPGFFDIGYSHEYGSASSITTIGVGGALKAGIWYYLGISRDATAKTVKFYVGNQLSVTLRNTGAYSNNADGGQDSSTKLIIGNQITSNGYPFNGVIQQHYLWNRVLSQSEHLAAANANPPTSGLVMGCNMGNTPEIDIIDPAITGAVTGTTLVTGH